MCACNQQYRGMGRRILGVHRQACLASLVTSGSMRDSISENRWRATEKDYYNPSLVSTAMLTCTWAHLHLPMRPHTCTHTGTCIYTHKRHDEWLFCCTQRTRKPAFGCATGHSRGQQPCSMYLRGNTRCICPVSLHFKFQ